MADPRFYAPPTSIGLGDIAQRIGAFLSEGADPAQRMVDVAPLDTATPDHVSFFDNRKYLPALGKTNAGAVIMSERFRKRAPETCSLLLTGKPYEAYAVIARAFHPVPSVVEAGISPSSHVDKTARLGSGCQVDAGAVIGPHAIVGARCRVRSNAFIGAGCVLGDDCDIGTSVSLSYAIVGSRVILHAGACIGQDGFGFARGKVSHTKVPQLGRVLIGDDVEIGANCSIDRGSGPDTIIGDGCKLDNLVQIAHNVRLGRGCVIAALSGISGSTTVEEFVVMGGQVGIAGHIRVGKGATIAAHSGVARSVPAGTVFGGYPARPWAEFRRINATVSRFAKRRAEEAD